MDRESQGDVLVVRPIPEDGLSVLRDHGCKVKVVGEDRALSAAELRQAARGCVAIIALPCNTIDDTVLEAAGPGLRVVSNYGVGVNHIDLDAAKKRGIRVANTPDIVTEATAEMAWALLFAAARGIVAADQFVRDGKWQGADALSFRGAQISGKTLGVIGAGRIGESFALKCQAFAMRVLYAHPRRNVVLEQKLGAQRADLDALLASADFVSLHVPLNEQTRCLLGKREFGLMKSGAILVNTSRGGVIDEAALVGALCRGCPVAAALDVFENEPCPHAGLLGMSNVVLTPHIGSGTREARARMAVMAADSILAVLEGRPVLHEVQA